MTERTCGECTLCCKVLGVAEIKKPPNVWCQHSATKKGCQIYNDRPSSCKEFSCVWLLSPDKMGDHLRPDKTHVVLASFDRPGATGLSAYVDPGYPSAYREGQIGELINTVAKKTTVLVILGQRALTKLGGQWIECKTERRGDEYAGTIDVYLETDEVKSTG